jgi:hypothetical protein
MKQTAVEWLIKELSNKLDMSEWSEEFNTALKREREQIELAFHNGTLNGHRKLDNTGTDYYNNRYNNESAGFQGGNQGDGDSGFRG